MSEIRKLIQELCPDGVEFKKLGDIAFYPKIRILSKGLNKDNYVSVENLLKDKKGKTCASSIPEGVAIGFKKNDVLIGNIRPYLKKIWLADCDGGTNGDVICVRLRDDLQIEILPKYLYYHLSSDSFFNYDNNHAKGGKMPRGDKKAILHYEIPVPPMAVQRRIVEILDYFSNLTAELEAELEERKRQYEYYRNLLLTFSPVANGAVTGGKHQIKDIPETAERERERESKVAENE